MTELCCNLCLLLLHLSILYLSQVSCEPKSVNSPKHGPTKRKSHDFVSSGRGHLETLSWAVKLTFDAELYSTQELDMVADLVAMETGLDNMGQIGEFKGHYNFAHKFHKDTTKHITSSYHSEHNLPSNNSANITNSSIDEGSIISNAENLIVSQPSQNLTDSEWWLVKESTHHQLDHHPYVAWHMQQLVRSRQKRSVKPRLGILVPDFDDPVFLKQWHLVNLENVGFDINVTGVWRWGVTGLGVTTAVIDDGLEWTNPDLKNNYSPEGSWDLNSNDADPMPHGEKEKNHHGTRCAGEIAAVANNGVCGVGVAFGAKVAGIRVLDGPMTDSLEATAFMKGYTVNDVYSCSWGPDDDGKTVDGPHYLATRAMRLGVDYGRQGYGSIYVVASGNGGMKGDNCNYDGYANSIYTVTIGAVDEYGSMPFYAEECASMLAVTYSSGNGIYQRSIVTTDWMKDGGTGCTESHTGTSAAAPIAAGIIALMLEARPCLTWRDVQYLIVMTAVKVDKDLAHWYTNAAGFHHSHKHGFGLMNAWAIVNAAKAWQPIPWMTLFTSEEMVLNAAIPSMSQSLQLNYSVTKEKLEGYQLYSLEYVQAIVTLKHDRRGDVEILLRCPSTTESVLGASRPNDDSRDGFQDWTFSTVRCWGEEPQGTYTLIISDKGRVPRSRGHLVHWRLKLFGSPMTTEQIKERRRMVRAAADGEYLINNISLPCPPPPLRNTMVQGISERILKVLTLCSAFCVVMGIYQSFEYALCYDDEKKDNYRLINLLKRARRMASTEEDGVLSSPTENLETSRLLGAESIPMHNLSTVGREILSAQSTDSTYSPLTNEEELHNISTTSNHSNACRSNSARHFTELQATGARPKSACSAQSRWVRNGSSSNSTSADVILSKDQASS